MHAGSDEGFVPNAKLNFITKSKTEDYHDQMNGKHFEEWMETQLFPNVPANSTIVMDNASYHSVKAEKLQRQTQINQKCRNGSENTIIEFSTSLKKKELYTLIKQVKPRFQKYRIDEIWRMIAVVEVINTARYAKKWGHEILRLPPYHCDLNPEELIWAQVKNYVARNNKTFKIKDIQELFEEALKKVTPENWKNACRHVLDIEKSYWDKENICDMDINDIVFKLAEDSDSGSSSSSDDDSD